MFPACPGCRTSMGVFTVPKGSQFAGLTFWTCPKTPECAGGPDAPFCPRHPTLPMRLKLGELPGFQGREYWWCYACRTAELDERAGVTIARAGTKPMMESDLMRAARASWKQSDATEELAP